MRGRLVAGNWKSNGDLAANQLLLGHLRAAAAGLKGVDCVVCAPYPYLFQIQKLLAGSTLTWGGQDVSQFGAGAYTGAVTAAMLREFGCRYAIVGHSERRSIFGENNAMVAAKFGAALQAGLTPILCVGETLQERESGAMEQVVGAQIDAVVAAAGVAALGKAVVAYEPVWAIGTGKTATPEQAQAGSPLSLQVTTPPSQIFLVVLGDTPGPLLFPGVPPILAGGNLFTVFGITDGSGNWSGAFTTPPAPPFGVYLWGQTITQDSSGVFAVSNAWRNLFVP